MRSRILKQSQFKSLIDIDVLALPRASTRCHRLYILVLRLYYKGWAHETHFSEWSVRAPQSHEARSRESVLSFQGFYSDNEILRLEPYWWYLLKTSSRLIADMFWLVSTTCNRTFWVFVMEEMVAPPWRTEHANNRWLNYRLYRTLWNKSVIYCQTGIPGVPSDEDHQR